MDIGGGISKITACRDNPCTDSFGGTTCAVASSGKGGVVCSSLPTCNIVEGSNWNVWSASCKMSGQHTVDLGETVKIKKSSSMSGELVIDPGSDTSGSGNRHFHVVGTLEMEDVTLTGGYAVSSLLVLL